MLVSIDGNVGGKKKRVDVNGRGKSSIAIPPFGLAKVER